MILDTNALSAWADGTPAIAPLLRNASRLVIPAIVLGEFDFGIRQSRYYSRYQAWLAQNLPWVDCAPVDQATATAYGDIRLSLKAAGTPIPVNDTWIAAIARQTSLPLLSRDAHFDAVAGLQRVTW